MTRQQIIDTVGKEFLVGNLETGEYSYPKALKGIGKHYKKFLVGHPEKEHKFADIRFESEKLVVLVETKDRFTKKNIADGMGQLQQYSDYEAQLRNAKKVVAILAATETGDVRVWQDGSGIIDESHVDSAEKTIRPMEEYVNLHFGTRNNKIAVIQSTYALNELLHGYGIWARIRGQFVGTCLLALKRGLKYKGLTTAQIRSGIETELETLLNKCLNKAEKLVILKQKVVDAQCVRDLKKEEFEEILEFVEERILPYINDKTTQGQDLLNLFFTTFNKYVGKSDKNQAFTPDHIVHFMCAVVGVNRHSVVLDPCCGSGAFLVRALTTALDDCRTEKERAHVKEAQIHGIESDETAFGLSTTNMLIHGDGNSNIRQGSCFNLTDWEDKGVNVVLMNPPYNATRVDCKPEYVKTWKKETKEDPSKGFHFAYEIAHRVKRGKLAVLLPMQCAIGSSAEIQRFKKLMLDENTLDAVFSLPSDMFHPGASACACCMVFNLGTRHENAPIPETFFGYFKDDGFMKKKNLGRIERCEGLWAEIEARWLDLYRHRKAEKGISAVRKVTADDEWLAEAYMETDYSTLTEKEFAQVVRDYCAYKIRNEGSKGRKTVVLTNSWGNFRVGDLFEVKKGKRLTKEDQTDGTTPYVGAIDSNNGVSNHIGQKALHDGGTISLSYNGSVGEAFYQPDPFWATDDVNVLYPRQGTTLNTWTALFICTVLRQEKYRYSYGRKWVLEAMNDTVIRLPKTSSGKPDWAAMERKIKGLPYGDRI